MILNKKIIVSGSVVECYDFSNGIWVASDSLSNGYGMNKRDNLRRLISSNLYRWRADNDKAFMPLFLTLTFREQDISIISARQQYALFIKRLAVWRKKIDKGVNKYVMVMELTKKGVPHFHIVLFNLPFVPDLFGVLGNLWGQGYILYKAIRGSGVNTAFYMAKYLSKQEKVRGRSYLASKGLLRPLVIYDEATIKDLMISIIAIDFSLYNEYSYPSINAGEVYYRMYVIKGNDFDVMKAIHMYVDETYPVLS